jgi:hypothetical protein
MSRRAVVREDLDECVERTASLRSAGACTLRPQLGGTVRYTQFAIGSANGHLITALMAF